MVMMMMMMIAIIITVNVVVIVRDHQRYLQTRAQFSISDLPAR